MPNIEVVVAILKYLDSHKINIQSSPIFVSSIHIDGYTQNDLLETSIYMLDKNLIVGEVKKYLSGTISVQIDRITADGKDLLAYESKGILGKAIDQAKRSGLTGIDNIFSILATLVVGR